MASKLEKKRDAAHAAFIAAEERLSGAAADRESAKRNLDGSDVAAAAHEAAERMHARRVAERNNIKSKLDEVDAEIENARVAGLRREYDERVTETDTGVLHVKLDALAKRFTQAAIDLQRALEEARAIGAEQSAGVERLRAIAVEIGELGTAPAFEPDSAVVVFGARLAAHAEAAGSKLEPLPVVQPDVLDREPRVGETMVPCHIEKVHAARLARSRWNDTVEIFAIKETHSDG